MAYIQKLENAFGFNRSFLYKWENNRARNIWEKLITDLTRIDLLGHQIDETCEYSYIFTRSELFF